MRTWPRSYLLVVIFQMKQLRAELPVIIALQVLLAGSAVLGFSLLVPNLDPTTALYLSTGAPTLALVATGLSGVPQSVRAAATVGLLDYVNTLPLPRLTYMWAYVTTLMFGLVPGAALALGVASLRFGFDLHPQLALIPAVALVIATTAAIGYAIALLAPSPVIVSLISQVLLFVFVFFSPVNYPADRLPEWAAALHEVFPLKHLAVLIRANLTGATHEVGRAFLIAGAWGAVALATAARLASRRT